MKKYGDGVLGEGAQSLFHQLGGLRERCGLFQWGSGGAPTAKGFPLFSALKMAYPADTIILLIVDNKKI